MSTTDPKVNFSIINKETKKVTTVSVPITKEVRRQYHITDVTFFRKGHCVWSGAGCLYENRVRKGSTYLVTLQNLETGATTLQTREITRNTLRLHGREPRACMYDLISAAV